VYVDLPLERVGLCRVEGWGVTMVLEPTLAVARTGVRAVCGVVR
jgi:hypothetical protein